MLGQAGQQDGAERHAQHAGGEFHQAVGVIQPRHAAGGEEGREDGVDEQADLRHRHAQRGGRHQLQDAAHAGIVEVPRGARQHADFHQVRQHPRQLQHAAQRHAPAQRQHRRVEIGRQPQGRGDHGDVEQHRRKRRHRKLAVGVEHAGRQRHQRDEDDVGEGDAQQRHGQREFFRIGPKSRRADIGHPGRAHDAEQGDDDQRQRQRGADLIDQGMGGLMALAAFVFRQDRHEGLRERAFGKQPPQQVGDLEGDEERVGEHARRRTRGR